MQHQVHAGDGAGHQVQLLAEQLKRAVLIALAPQVEDARQQHAAGAAGRVVHRLAGPRLHHLRHQVDDGAVGVELGGRVAAVVGELLDEVLVTLAELVLRHVRQ